LQNVGVFYVDRIGNAANFGNCGKLHFNIVCTMKEVGTLFDVIDL
jgi:hypothetical protein